MSLKIGWLHEAENNLGTWLHEADDWHSSTVAGRDMRSQDPAKANTASR